MRKANHRSPNSESRLTQGAHHAESSSGRVFTGEIPTGEVSTGGDHADSPSTISGWWLAAALLLPLLWCFGRGMVGPEDMIRRDLGRFFMPRYEYVAEQWSAGRIPLWDPLSNCGEPLLANATCAVLYPGQLVFHIGLPFLWAFKWFIVGHVVLAIGAQFWLGTRLGLTRGASALVAVCYVFSGSVLYQHCNLPFLISAAWLPVALGCGLAWLRERRLWGVLGLAVVLAVMTLGGDPQMAYHVGLVLGLAALLLPVVSAPDNENAVVPSSSGWRLRTGRLWAWRLSGLAGAAGLALLLAAAQILPTAEFAQRSTRVSNALPQNLWQVPGYLWREAAKSSGSQAASGAQVAAPAWYDAILGRPPPPAKHYLSMYSYSQSPARLPEMVLPHFSGAPFASSGRWLSAAGLEDAAIWQPTIYMGWLPALLVIAGTGLRRTVPEARWLWWGGVLSVAASWGSYGIPGCYALIKAVVTGEPVTLSLGEDLGHEVGGVYWLLATLLPEYAGFRYPAKWMVMAACLLSLLAGLGWQCASRQMLWRAFRVLGALTTAAAMTVLIAWLMNTDGWAGAPDAPWFLRGDTWLWFSLVWVSCQAMLVWRFVLPSRTPHDLAAAAHAAPQEATSRRGSLLLVWLVAVDVSVANGPLVEFYPTAQWQAPCHVAEVIAADRQARGLTDLPSPPRVMIAAPEPPGAEPAMLSGEDADFLAVGRRIMLAENHFQLDLCNVQLPSTVQDDLYAAYMDYMIVKLNPQDEGSVLRPRRSLDLWGTEYFVLVTGRESAILANSWTGQETGPLRWVYPEGPTLPELGRVDYENGEGFRVFRNLSAFPRAWVVHDVRAIPPLDNANREAWLPVMQSLVFPRDQPINFATTAIVETDQSEQFSPLQPATGPEPAVVEDYAADRLSVQVELQTPGLLVLSEPFAEGWQAQVSTGGNERREAPVLLVNRRLRGVLLPAGRHQVTMEYRPAAFVTGVWLSLAGLTLWLLLAVVLLAGTRRRTSHTAVTR